MEQKDNLQTRNPDTVTISRSEYEEFQAQRKKISELESRVDMLMEALRLARHKQETETRVGVVSERKKSHYLQ